MTDSLTTALTNQLAELRREAEQLAALVVSTPLPARIAAQLLIDLDQVTASVFRNRLALIDARDSRREDEAFGATTT